MPGSVGVTTLVLISDGSDTGGSYATGIVDMPHMFWPPNGVPPPSMQMMPLTRFGRISATSQPNGPPAEWVMMIDGPILSSSIAPRCRHTMCAVSAPAAAPPSTGGGVPAHAAAGAPPCAAPPCIPRPPRPPAPAGPPGTAPPGPPQPPPSG